MSTCRILHASDILREIFGKSDRKILQKVKTLSTVSTVDFIHSDAVSVIFVLFGALVVALVNSVRPSCSSGKHSGA